MLAVAFLLAWLPFGGQPLWGQAPSVRVQSSRNQKKQPKLGTINSSDAQIGTKESPVVVDITQRPKTQAEAAEDKRKDDTKEYRDRWTFRLTVITVIISGLLLFAGVSGVYAAIRTLRAIEKQAILMEGQLNEMQAAGLQATKHLGLTERPWLHMHVALAGPLTVTDTEARIPLLITLANFGKSVAVGIWINPELYLMHVDRPNIITELKRLSEEAKACSAVNLNFGHILFPGNMPFIQQWSVGIPIADIEKYSLDEFYSVEVVICVAYRSTIDQSARHCTGIVYDLHRIDPQRPAAAMALRKGENYQPEMLRLTLSPLMAPITD
jgi:hypothetical protein